MTIHEIINKIYPLPDTSIEKLSRCLSEETYPKGYKLLETGRIETNLFFIKKGIVRVYMPVDGKDITFWIGKEGDTIVSLKSYINNLPGYETIELIEESVLYVLKRKDIQKLFNEDINIANWGRRFAESELLKTEEKLIPLLYTTASERYINMIENTPELLQRIPLEHIASYLGVTPVSLSRIRANIAILSQER